MPRSKLQGILPHHDREHRRHQLTNPLYPVTYIVSRVLDRVSLVNHLHSPSLLHVYCPHPRYRLVLSQVVSMEIVSDSGGLFLSFLLQNPSPTPSSGLRTSLPTLEVAGYFFP